VVRDLLLEVAVHTGNPNGAFLSDRSDRLVPASGSMDIAMSEILHLLSVNSP